MEFLNFPIVALAAALVCLIGVTLYAITQRGSIRSRDEQLVVARAQAYAMLELSHAGVLFLDREHKLMGEASAAAPELLGHTCGAGTAFVQVIAELVPVAVRRETVSYLESLWKADATALVDPTQNPLQRVHSGSRHLALRFSRLVVDGRVHHIIVSIERISAPRLVPHTIEVPALNEETFAKRLAGETGTRRTLTSADLAAMGTLETGAVAAPPSAFDAVASSAATTMPAPPAPADAVASSAAAAVAALPPMTTGEFELGSMDVTSDSVPTQARAVGDGTAGAASLAHVSIENIGASSAGLASSSTSATGSSSADSTQNVAALSASLPTHLPREHRIELPAAMFGAGPDVGTLATTLSSTDVASTDVASTDVASTDVAPTDVASTALAKGPPQPDPSSIIDPPDARLNEVLQELFPLDPSRVELFLGEGREKAGQLRAIMKLPAREPQAFREKLVLILELIRGIHARAERLPLPSVSERADRFEAALNQLRDKQTLSGNDFLPLAVKLDDLLSHLAIQGEVATRLREWREKTGAPIPASADAAAVDATQRSATMTGTTIRQPRLPASAAGTGATTISGPLPSTQKAARLSDLSKESLEEMAAFLADMYGKRVSLVCVGLEDVPQVYRRMVEKLLGQLIHNAIRHGIESPADRGRQDKPEIGTVAVQFLRTATDDYQLSVQDDGRGLDHDRIRSEAVRQGVMTADEAAKVDPRKLATLIFRAGFTTAGEGGARGIGMDLVRDLVNKANGRVGVATKPKEYTRIRVTLPHEKKVSDAAVA